MRKWIDLVVENFERDFTGTLYHATASDNVESCLNGVNAPSYWGIGGIVDYYIECVEDEGDEAAVLAVNLSDLDESLLEPDYPGLQEPVIYSSTGKGEKQVWKEWEASEKTWRDSLRIIGSVRYNGVVKPYIED